MKLKILLLVGVMTSLSFGLFGESERRTGNRVIVKRGDTVVYSTPCGYTNIINPLNVQRGGGFLSGGADVEVMNTITVTYTSKSCGWGCYSMGSMTVKSTVKNFPMNDYELDFIQEDCTGIAYEVSGCKGR